MRHFTVVGTDTGVGKTFVTAALIKAARRGGTLAFGLKPVESGIGETAKSDTAILAEASERAPAETNLVQFEPAIAPGLIGHNATEIDELVGFVVAQGGRTSSSHGPGSSALAQVCFVETAGGWYSPLSQRGDVRELAAMLAAPVIVVGKASLGAINQIRLTVAAVAAAQLSIAMVVLSQRPSDDEALAAQNEQAIAQRTGLSTMRLSSEDDAASIVAALRKDTNFGW